MGARQDMRDRGGEIYMAPFIKGTDIDAAAELIETFGESAGGEAAARAGRSRDMGNHIHFCRWRQIERLIGLMSSDHALGTVH